MASLRTEKAIKVVLETVKQYQGNVIVSVDVKPRDVSFHFFDVQGKPIAAFTLSSIVRKRVAKRKKK